MTDVTHERTTAAVQEKKLSSDMNKLQIYLEFVESEQNIAKFWSIQVGGARTIRRWGRMPIGNKAGWEKNLVSNYDSNQTAIKTAWIMIKRKLKKGYVKKSLPEVIQ